MDLHDLTAAYALDALDEREVELYERHLAGCELCQAQLAEFSESAAALAFGAVAPAPPPQLRAGILDAAQHDSSNVIPIARRRWVVRGFAVAAAAAACAAVGIVVATTQSSGTRVVSALVVLGADRSATLRVTGLSPAPRGKTYEAWVIPAGGRAKPAGLFSGERTTTLRLRGTVPKGAVVAVTIERAGGARAPTSAPLLTAHA
jgi:anti-sigma-K factor RskA